MITTYLDDEERQRTQVELQSILREMQQATMPRTPRVDPPTLMESFLDQATLIEMPAMPRTDKLPTLHQKTNFESWLDAHIYEYWQAEHKFPYVIHISSIRKLEYIVEQLERGSAPVRWHEYEFHHAKGWIAIRLETKIMGYNEVECE